MRKTQKQWSGGPGGPPPAEEYSDLNSDSYSITPSPSITDDDADSDSVGSEIDDSRSPSPAGKPSELLLTDPEMLLTFTSLENFHRFGKTI